MKHPIRPSRTEGAALVVTLIVVVALATVLVAFMQNTTMERSSSRSGANYYRAELASDSGIAEAISNLWLTTRASAGNAASGGPYATVFFRDPAGAESPYLLFARRDIQEDKLVTRRVPLFSTAHIEDKHFDTSDAPLIDRSPRIVEDVEGGSPVTRNVSREEDLLRDINMPLVGRPNGLIGLAAGNSRMVVPVNWIYLSNSLGEIVGRYAYWVDDESSKLDLRFAGSASDDDQAEPLDRQFGTNRGEVSLGIFAEKGLSAEQLRNLRSYKIADLPFDDKSFARFPLLIRGNDNAGIADQSLWEQVRPFLTTASLHDRRAPDGKLKLNLNNLVKAEPADTDRIGRELNAVASAITENLPEFSKRASSDAGVADREFYVRKLAANIRDFIDEDHIPTMVARDGNVLSFSGVAPGDFIPLGTDLIVQDIPAIGKERGPYLSEYLRIVRVISETPVEGVANMFNLEVVIAHYVELHNPTGNTITAADLPGGYVLLANREPWENGSAQGTPAALRPSDIVMRLPTDFTIPPNGYAVLTTDDTVIPQVSGTAYTLTRGNGPGQWATMDPGGTTPPLPGAPEKYAIRTVSGDRQGQNRNTRFNFYIRTTSAAPYQDASERLIFGANDGVIDAAPKIYTAVRHYLGRGVDNPVCLWTFPSDPFTSNRNSPTNSDQDPRFNRGDVRANMEISRIGNHAGATWRPPATGGPVYAQNFQTAAAASLTLGTRNYRYDRQIAPTGDNWWRQGWKEYTDDAAGNHFVANRPLRSVGELGFIYDPARHLLTGFRSHGATLRMGQSDDGSNNRAANNRGQNFQDWLGGRGTDDATKPEYLRNSFLLSDVFEMNDLSAGRVNPNSVVRDQGFVFRSLVDGFTFQSSPEEGASTTLSAKGVNTNTFVPAMVTNAASAGGFVSLGDLSRAPVFHQGSEFVANVDMAINVSDSGKEEFFRRTVELLTTHGLAFTIYAVGQSGGFKGDAFIPTATAVKEVVVQLEAQYPTPADEFQRVAPNSWRLLKVSENNL